MTIVAVDTSPKDIGKRYERSRKGDGRMSKAVAKEVVRLECSDCESNVYTCDGCFDYFRSGSPIECKDGKHYCSGCGGGR